MKYNHKRRSHHSKLVTASVSSLLVAAVIIGSITSVSAAGRNDRFTQPTVQRSSNSEPSQTNSTTGTPTQTTTTTPKTSAPAAKTTTVTPTPAATQAPVVTSQPIAPAAPKPVVPPDTAAAAKTTTTAQSDVASIVKPVKYTSNQISIDTRNRLITLAGVIGFAGFLLYATTLFIPVRKTRHIPVRIPVEVVAR